MKNGFPTNYTCIDIETTSLRLDCDIIELAAARVRDNKVTETFQELVKPTMPIPAGITEITGITNQDVHNSRSIKEVFPDFLNFLENDVIIGHNIFRFDLARIDFWTRVVFEKPFSPDFIDTLELSEEIPLKHHTLEVMCDYYGIVNQTAHRALSDVMATIELYNHLVNNDRNPDYVEKSVNKKHFGKFVNSKDIVPNVTEFETSHPLYGRLCVISGVFKVPRKQMMQAIADVGGVIADNVTRKTDFLILGNPNEDGQGGVGGTKWRKAEEYKGKGFAIKYLSEDEFIKLIKKEIENV